MAGNRGKRAHSRSACRSLHAAIRLVQGGSQRLLARDLGSRHQERRVLAASSFPFNSVTAAGWQACVRAGTLALSLQVDWPVRGERSSAGALIGVVERVGEWSLARWSDGAAFATLAGEAVFRAAPALRGKVRTRAGNLLNLIYGTNAAALPMVVLVNVLVGVIVAFVGGIQLRRRAGLARALTLLSR
jgi:hypothetical protein